MKEQFLEKQSALVTGASGGIGAAIVRALSKAGAAVAIHYHSGRERAEELAAELKESGRQAVPLGADLREAGEIRTLYDEAETVAFLASPAGRWINGTVITADGGYSA